jgi:hypothetical protein
MGHRAISMSVTLNGGCRPATTAAASWPSLVATSSSTGNASKVR